MPSGLPAAHSRSIKGVSGYTVTLSAQYIAETRRYGPTTSSMMAGQQVCWKKADVRRARDRQDTV